MADTPLRAQAEFSVEEYRGARPAQYVAVFARDPTGRAVLEDLQGRFYDREIYVKGGPEGARETERRAAHREVIAFIHRMIAVGETPAAPGGKA